MSYKRFAPDGGKGKTRLFDGQQISKSDLRMEVIGDLDELNCLLGLVGGLEEIQTHLMLISAYLAVPGSTLNNKVKEQISNFEQDCNHDWDQLPQLKNFVIPTGNNRGGWLNLARAVCRRTERHTVVLSNNQTIDELAILYLNRLSDWLFVKARLSNHQSGLTEVTVDLSVL